MDKTPQCITCRHNIRISSCSPCIKKGSKLIELIADDLFVDQANKEDNFINSFKSSCKILLKYPEDYHVVDPYNCKYYLSSKLQF